jgi:hypothetical protein
MIRQERSAAVPRGLREAFGVIAFEDIRLLTRGLGSALVFCIVVQGSPYLLRIITPIGEINNPSRQFTCMKAAAEAGLAPQVWQANMEDGISITDFVTAVPFPAAEAPCFAAISQNVQLGHGAQRTHLGVSGDESSPQKRNRGNLHSV